MNQEVRHDSRDSDEADLGDPLKLKNQICFPLYACAKEVVKAYKPYLDELDLTYTQYITMMVMWEHRELRVSRFQHADAAS